MHGAVSTGCEESVLKDLQKDKNAVEKEREPRKSALSFVLEFLLPTLLPTLSPMLYNVCLEGRIG